MLPGKRKISRITAMQKAEIKQIAAYLKDLEEGLVEWDYRGITTQGQLTELYGIIERLMQATFEKTRIRKNSGRPGLQSHVTKTCQQTGHCLWA
jgi:hypothetical protein